MINREYDPEEEQFAEVDAFLDWLNDKEDKYCNEPRLQVINQKRLKEFEYAFINITRIVKKASPDAIIEYDLNDGFNTGHGGIQIETDELSTTKIKEFIEAIKFASDFEVFPLTNGNIKIILGFKGLLDDIPTKQGG